MRKAPAPPRPLLLLPLLLALFAPGAASAGESRLGPRESHVANGDMRTATSPALRALPSLPSGITQAADESVVFKAEHRLRFEDFRGVRFDRSRPGHADDYLQSRLLLDLSPKKPGAVGWGMTLQTSSLWFSEGIDARRRPARSQDRFNIHQAWLETALAPGSPWRVKAGRQLLNFGDATVFGAGNWNLCTLWDGVRLSRATRRMKLDLVAARGVDLLDDEPLAMTGPAKIAAVYASFPNLCMPGGHLDAYFIGNENPRTRFDTRTVGLRFHGGRTDGVQFDIEAPFQTGTAAGVDHRAHALRIQAMKQWRRLPLKPRFGYEYRHATGDRPGSAARREAFDTLYATSHGHLGSMDLFTWTNVRSHALLSRWFFSRKFDLEIDVFRFSLMEPSAGFAGRRPAAGQAVSDEAGVEVDLTFKYAFTKDIALMGGTSRFRPGAFLRDTAAGAPTDAAAWSFLQLTSRW